MKDANLARVETEKKLNLRHVEKKTWRPSTSLGKSKSQVKLQNNKENLRPSIKHMQQSVLKSSRNSQLE
jgi:tRNA threonylcarbamoyladenosine modification (KEOPS) complex  Pcc1 subunit